MHLRKPNKASHFLIVVLQDTVKEVLAISAELSRLADNLPQEERQGKRGQARHEGNERSLQEKLKDSWNGMVRKSAMQQASMPLALNG